MCLIILRWLLFNATQEDIERKYRELVQMNEDICRNTCQDALKQLYEPIKENLKAGKYTRSGGFRLYKDDIRVFEETYKLRIGRIGVKVGLLLQLYAR